MITALVFLLGTSQVWGWAEHHVLTRKALRPLPQFQNVKVEVTDWQEMLMAIGYKDENALNDDLKIRKDFRFKPALNEKKGDRVNAIDVLATYSDEPDWKMETELYEVDQRPELWRPEYTFMGGKKGTPSQAFRHMYWRGLSFMQPLATFKMPIDKIFSSMGEAPERAEIFINLSRKAMKACHQYWALRFMANGMHYLGDVASPFHANQTPSKKFILMPFTDPMGAGLKSYVRQVTNVVSYYHFAFENYLGRMMVDSEKGIVNDATKTFTEALEQTREGYYDGDVQRLVITIAQRSLSQSANAANASIEFFPPMKESFETIEVQKSMNDQWWSETLARGEASTPAKQEYFAAVLEMYRPLGEAIRSLVVRESKPIGSACEIMNSN